MDDCLDNAKSKCICVSICTVFVVLISMLAFSWGTVEPTEYGILYNTISKQIDEDPLNIYEGGISFTGPFSKLITFPRTH
jgi:hypothetical protein